MPRRREIPKREILPDPGSVRSSVQFMNVIMESGQGRRWAHHFVRWTRSRKKAGKDREVFRSPEQREADGRRPEPPRGRWNSETVEVRPRPPLWPNDALAEGIGPQAR